MLDTSGPDKSLVRSGPGPSRIDGLGLPLQFKGTGQAQTGSGPARFQNGPNSLDQFVREVNFALVSFEHRCSSA